MGAVHPRHIKVVCIIEIEVDSLALFPSAHEPVIVNVAITIKADVSFISVSHSCFLLAHGGSLPIIIAKVAQKLITLLSNIVPKVLRTRRSHHHHQAR